MNEITLPKNCLLCIAMPVTYEEFIDLSSSEERSNYIWYNYVKSNNLSNKDNQWKEYKALLDIIMETVNEVRKAGGNVILSFSGKDLCRIADYEVVTIIAHWVESKKCIELFDGVYSPEEFVKRMPDKFNGLLDLTVCHSAQLIELIKEHYPNCLMLTNAKSTQIEFRLILYKAITKLLEVSPMSFMDAYTYLIKQLIKYYQ